MTTTICTDYIVRYQGGLSCLTSLSVEDAETVARLLWSEGVQDVRVFRRVTQTREEEVKSVADQCAQNMIEHHHERITQMNERWLAATNELAAQTKAVKEALGDKSVDCEKPIGPFKSPANQEAVNALFDGMPPVASHTATSGCKEWLNGQKRPGIWQPYTGAEGYFAISTNESPVRFCPWCGEAVR